MKAVKLEANLWDIPAQYGSFLLRHQRYSDALVQFRKVHALMFSFTQSPWKGLKC